MKVKSESEVTQSCPTLATPWTAAHQASLSMGSSRQKYWSGVPLPSPTISMRKVNTDSSSNVVYHLNLICKQTQLSIDRSPPSDQFPESLTSSPFREPMLWHGLKSLSFSRDLHTFSFAFPCFPLLEGQSQVFSFQNDDCSSKGTEGWSVQKWEKDTFAGLLGVLTLWISLGAALVRCAVSGYHSSPATWNEELWWGHGVDGGQSFPNWRPWPKSGSQNHSSRNWEWIMVAINTRKIKQYALSEYATHNKDEIFCRSFVSVIYTHMSAFSPAISIKKKRICGQQAISPCSHPSTVYLEGIQDGKKPGYWPKIAEVHIKGMISMSRSLASSHTKKIAKFLTLRYLVSFN